MRTAVPSTSTGRRSGMRRTAACSSSAPASSSSSSSSSSSWRGGKGTAAARRSAKVLLSSRARVRGGEPARAAAAAAADARARNGAGGRATGRRPHGRPPTSAPAAAQEASTSAASASPQRQQRRLQFRLGRLSALVRMRRVYHSALRSEELLAVLPALLRMQAATRGGDPDGGGAAAAAAAGEPARPAEQEWSLPLPAAASLGGLAVDGLDSPAFAGDAAADNAGGDEAAAGGDADGEASPPPAAGALRGDWALLQKLIEMVEELQMLGARMRSEVREMDAASAYRFLFIGNESRQLVRPELITQGEAERLVAGAVTRQAERIRSTIALVLRDVPFRSPADARAVLDALEAQGFRFEEIDAGAGGTARDGFLSQLTERYDSLFSGGKAPPPGSGDAAGGAPSEAGAAAVGADDEHGGADGDGAPPAARAPGAEAAGQAAATAAVTAKKIKRTKSSLRSAKRYVENVWFRLNGTEAASAAQSSPAPKPSSSSPSPFGESLESISTTMEFLETLPAVLETSTTDRSAGLDVALGAGAGGAGAGDGAEDEDDYEDGRAHGGEEEGIVEALAREVAVIERDLRRVFKERDVLLRDNTVFYTSGSVSRAADAVGRVQMARDIQTKDESVSTLRRLLSVKSMQIDCEKIYRYLESESKELVLESKIVPAPGSGRRPPTDESLVRFVRRYAYKSDAASNAGGAGAGGAEGADGPGAAPAKAGALADRRRAKASDRGSDEMSVYVADFADISYKLVSVIAETDACNDVYFGGKGAAAKEEVKEGPPAPACAMDVDDVELAQLATAVADLKFSLGIDYGGGEFIILNIFDTSKAGRASSALSLKRAARFLASTRTKLVDGFVFSSRCVRLLVVDVSTSGRLFWKALNGTTLKMREVRQLRRTARDLLVFIPFAVILIAPLTPIGHVAIFAFIQKYFPDLFPSQLSIRRQELMLRYDEIKRQLRLSAKREQRKEEKEELMLTAQALEALRMQNRGGGGGGVEGGGADGGADIRTVPLAATAEEVGADAGGRRAPAPGGNQLRPPGRKLKSTP